MRNIFKNKTACLRLGLLVLILAIGNCLTASDVACKPQHYLKLDEKTQEYRCTPCPVGCINCSEVRKILVCEGCIAGYYLNEVGVCHECK